MDEKDWTSDTLKEAPFYREGMSQEEYDIEREYHGKNTKLVLSGQYEPLWKQRQKRES